MLMIKGHVLRELFLRSGNLCAYPGCNRLMLDESGSFLGELCHIEAAETGGERFNKDMTNEQRRAAPNLILMRHDHHVRTDNVDEYALKKTALPKSAAGQAANYTLSFWSKLTVFLKHTELELSTNLAENSMRPIAIGRKNWLHLGSKEAEPKIAAIFSVVESCRL